MAVGVVFTHTLYQKTEPLGTTFVALGSVFLGLFCYSPLFYVLIAEPDTYGVSPDTKECSAPDT